MTNEQNNYYQYYQYYQHSYDDCDPLIPGYFDPAREGDTNWSLYTGLKTSTLKTGDIIEVMKGGNKRLFTIKEVTPSVTIEEIDYSNVMLNCLALPIIDAIKEYLEARSNSIKHCNLGDA